ncbi:hypothetical protein, partial [Enterobacter intestinihominis]
MGGSPFPPYKFVPVRTRHLTPLHYYPNTPFSSGRQEPQFVPQTSFTPTAAAELHPPAIAIPIVFMSLINKSDPTRQDTPSRIPAYALKNVGGGGG